MMFSYGDKNHLFLSVLTAIFQVGLG